MFNIQLNQAMGSSLPMTYHFDKYCMFFGTSNSHNWGKGLWTILTRPRNLRDWPHVWVTFRCLIQAQVYAGWRALLHCISILVKMDCPTYWISAKRSLTTLVHLISSLPALYWVTNANKPSPQHIDAATRVTENWLLIKRYLNARWETVHMLLFLNCLQMPKTGHH